MRFKITGEHGHEWVFDNQSNKIVCLGDASTNIDVVRQIVPPLPNQKPFSLTKSKTVQILKIQLGTNCNYKCSYCIQRDYLNKTRMPTATDLEVFFKKLDDAGIVLADKAKIELWGGEPLVYWKLLRVLLPKLRERWPTYSISMVTNGTLLTEEIVKFFLEHRVHLKISHDAQAQFLRGMDPLDDPAMRKLWMDTFDAYLAHSLGFKLNMVISPENVDLFEAQEFFASKLHPAVPFVYEGAVMVYSTNTVRFASFPKDRAETLRNSIHRALLQEPQSNVAKALNKWEMDLLQRIAYETPTSLISAKCNNVLSDVLSVDLAGNVLDCHNVDPITHSIGELEDFDNVRTRFVALNKRQNCKQCLVVSSCKGNCPRHNEWEHNASCLANKLIHQSLFEVVWFILTGERISRIKLATIN